MDEWGILRGALMVGAIYFAWMVALDLIKRAFEE